MSSLLHDVYNYGVKFGVDPGLLCIYKNVSYILEIDAKGNTTLIKHDKKEFLPELFPRSSNKEARELHDVEKYVFGELSDLFWTKTKEILDKSGVKEYIKAIEKIKMPKRPEKDEGGFFVLRFKGESDFMINNPKVMAVLDTDEKVEGTCLLSGEKDIISRFHPAVKIPGFKDSGALLSFNDSAFEYKGLKQAYNFPIGKKARKIYVKALSLIVQKSIRINSSTALIIWSDTASNNEDQIINFIKGDEYLFEDKCSGNIHVLFMNVKQGRNSILSYDVLPESEVIKNIRNYSDNCGELLKGTNLSKTLYCILGAYSSGNGFLFAKKPTDKNIDAFSELEINFYKHILLGDKICIKLKRTVYNKTKTKVNDIPYLKDYIAQEFVRYLIKEGVRKGI
jgi:hypothetical protein